MIKDNLNSLKVLLLDDDAFMNQIIRGFLFQAKIDNVDSVLKGDDALNLIETHEYDLVICDLNMPEMDGVEFFRYLADRKFLGDIIIVSSCDNQLLDSVGKLVRQHGMSLIGSLQKPFEKEALFSLICNQDLSSNTTESISSSAPKKLTAEELLTAMKSKRLRVYYQPKICVKTQTIKGAECLARLLSNKGEVISPLCFIETAEKENLIHELTIELFEIATLQLAQWHKKSINLKLAFNLSQVNLAFLELPEKLAEICRENNINTHDITFEITETSVTESLLTSLDVMARLRLQGFALAIDDFGTGYSSIEKLRQLPFNELKVDRQFVSGVLNNQNCVSILRNSINLGKDLEMNVVVEGVETQEEYEYLCQLGCDEVQGFWFAKPLSAIDFEKWYEGYKVANKIGSGHAK